MSEVFGDKCDDIWKYGISQSGDDDVNDVNVAFVARSRDAGTPKRHGHTTVMMMIIEQDVKHESGSVRDDDVVIPHCPLLLISR
jgi:hypothetical protein